MQETSQKQSKTKKKGKKNNELDLSNIKQNFDLNTTSNNRGKKINKKQLMAMTKEERADLIFKDMNDMIEQYKDNKPLYNAITTAQFGKLARLLHGFS